MNNEDYPMIYLLKHKNGEKHILKTFPKLLQKMVQARWGWAPDMYEIEKELREDLVRGHATIAGIGCSYNGKIYDRTPKRIIGVARILHPTKNEAERLAAALQKGTALLFEYNLAGRCYVVLKDIGFHGDEMQCHFVSELVRPFDINWYSMALATSIHTA